ncbi:lantibiotic dehydratase [Actinomadura spongiicola]|uniref:Lantibiotic dehydratase n=1 Tax=Actinomadura spongiicola TaxID=2303421 RepID=A0A372G7U9_9ACTN|nr:lantibiotic dehydratase [Actinomadura spongiicola]RFS81446.1 lantibiotic dehydratase [Actinomadura spongiicola]
MAARPADYRWTGAALLRASTAPGRLDLPADLDPDDPRFAARAVAWLSQVAQRPEIHAAVVTASPALIEAVNALTSSEHPDPRQVRRAVIAMASYLLRWHRRPTPFGLFAGVAVARFGRSPVVAWGPDHQAVVRADASWIGDVLAALHKNPELVGRLPVIANNAGYVRGGRFVVPGPAPDGATQGLAPVEVSVRHSRPVRAAVEAARRPVPFGELTTRLADEFPAASNEQIKGMLIGLLQQNVLISSLQAPMTCTDALGHVCSELRAARAYDIPAINGLVDSLSRVHRSISANSPAIEPAWARVTQEMKTVSQVASTPLAIDTLLDCEVQLPEQVAREARDAVDLLYRLSPYPFGYPAWRDYHTRFLARYGTGAVVPVLELVADSGLGLPAEYLGSPWGRALRAVTEREEQMLALIQNATMSGDDEIVLTDQVIERLSSDHATGVSLPSRVEIAVEVGAASLEALNRGRFVLRVTGTPRPGSSMIGRHAHLPPGDSRDLLAQSFALSGPDTVAVQLTFPPRRRRNENITRTQQFLPTVIALGEHRPCGPDHIPLVDLAVTADKDRFQLVRISTGQRVEPRVAHALEAGVHTPPLARFLAEVSTSRCAVYKAFHFGVAAQMPFLPRVRYRRTILAPARWLLSADDLPGHDAPAAEWSKGLDAWRERWRVPEHVAMVDHDRRQPVDLSHRLHRLLLRTRLRSAGRLELRETFAPDELAWIGRAHEIVIPFTRATGPVRPRGDWRRCPPENHALPGRSSVLYVQIHGHPARFDEVLTEHTAKLIDAFGQDPPPWWFRRHREIRRPEVDPYLALYLGLSSPAAYGTAAEKVSDWAAGLRRERLVSHITLATYQPQTGRYGHGAAMDAALQVFAADSRAAIAQIITATKAGIRPQALAAVSMVDLAISLTGARSESLRWLIQELPQQHGLLDPELRAQALALADPDRQWANLQALPGGFEATGEWGRRADALTSYRKQFDERRDVLGVLHSLLHLHHNRAVGVDVDQERVTNRLVRACALRYTASHRER